MSTKATSAITSTRKKTLIILVLTTAFAVGMFLSALLLSKNLDLTFWVYQDDYAEMHMRYYNEGIVETESITPGDGFVRVRMRGLREGETEAELVCQKSDPGLTPDIIGTKLFVTAYGMIYSSRYTFNGMHVAFTLMALFFLTVSILLYVWYRESRRAMFFSYKSVQDLGLSIYFLFQALMLGGAVFYSLVIRSAPLEGEHLFTINSFTLTLICLLAFPVLLLFSLLITISNIGLIRREGKRPANALGILLSIVLMLGLFTIAILALKSPNLFDINPSRAPITIARGIISSLFFYFVCNLFSTLLHCQRAGRHNPSYDKDFLIILGCGIREDGTLYPLLQGRADRAIRFYREQLEKTGKKAYFVPSGGQGADECMPEGEAIKNYLLTQGIPEEQILPETRSVNTLQNMKFSGEIILKQAENTDHVAFSTTNFHVFRSGILAADAGMNADGMGAKTKWYFWPNALIRECIGMLAREWKLHAIMCTLMVLQAVVSGNLQLVFRLF